MICMQEEPGAKIKIACFVTALICFVTTVTGFRNTISSRAVWNKLKKIEKSQMRQRAEI